MEKMTEYKEACAYINHIVKFTKKNHMEHTRECLHLLGDPDKSFRCIHVAGTNGKGSVCAFISSVLTEAGISNGLFTSPHLITMRERFRINGEMISEEDFVSAYQKVLDVSEEMDRSGKLHPTYFEFLFLMSMVYFAEKGVKVVVLETGMGGRLDATSVITDPYLCIITEIGKDHTQYLGKDIGSIAYEKAGILTKGVPVIYDATSREVASVIENEANLHRSKTIPVSLPLYKILRNNGRDIDFSMPDRYDKDDFLTIHFPAPYQVRNASIAVLACEELVSDYPETFAAVTKDVIAGGIAHTTWEGRMEEVLPGVIIDGAHNEDGIDAFIEAVSAMRGTKPVSLLFSSVSDKDYEGMIGKLVKKLPLSHVTVTAIPGSRKVEASELAFIFRECGMEETESYREIPEAFEEALKHKEDGLLFAVGSLYLAGAVKLYLKEKQS